MKILDQYITEMGTLSLVKTSIIRYFTKTGLPAIGFKDYYYVYFKPINKDLQFKDYYTGPNKSIAREIFKREKSSFEQVYKIVKIVMTNYKAK